jgi:nitronate monooxygenase
MNLWVSMEDEGALTSTEEAFHRSLSPLAKHIEDVGGARPTYRPYEPIRFEDQVQVLMDEGISTFSFIYGIPSKQILDEFRRQGTALIGTVTTVDEAIALEQAGVDVIAASGFEAGGHRGSFLQPSEDSLTGTMALVPQVVDAVKLPVVAAGGIGDARGIVAAFALGAEGVQMGTAFLACEESGATMHHRKALLGGQAKQTALTRGFTGRLARGIKNRLLDELNNKDAEILPYPLQRALVRHLAIPAEKAGRPELLTLWAGQSASLSRYTDVHTLLETLVKEIAEIGGAVQSWAHIVSERTRKSDCVDPLRRRKLMEDGGVSRSSPRSQHRFFRFTITAAFGELEGTERNAQQHSKGREVSRRRRSSAG